jgi:hypothetical protein
MFTSEIGGIDGRLCVSRYLDGGPLPPSVSLDQVAKVASRIEQMADRMLKARVDKPLTSLAQAVCIPTLVGCGSA